MSPPRPGRRSVSRYHMLLQEIVASWLESRGYDVSLEEPLPGGLVADVYAESPWGTVIVEVETGYVSPRALKVAEHYLEGRIIGKALKYSRYSDVFAVAAPSYYRPPIPLEAFKRGGVLLVDGVFLEKALLAGSAWKGVARIDAVLGVNVAERSVVVTPLSRRGEQL